MATYLCNAFSINMLPPPPRRSLVEFTPISSQEAATLLGDGYINAIGHADTAAVVAGHLGILLSSNRQDVKFCTGDVLVVAQYRGPRLPEGATSLPENAQIVYYRACLALLS
jgi:hypothetical protein